MKLPIYQVDAFASALFRGNPAAVCPLTEWLPVETMQAIALENNLAETAFYLPIAPGRYGLRWFTPTVEIDLCGHATIATAAVIQTIRRETDAMELIFESRSGELKTRYDGQLFYLDFPARPPKLVEPPSGLTAALGGEPSFVLAARDLFCVFDTEDKVRNLDPDLGAVAKLPYFAVIVTAHGSAECDFVSRFFAPAKGVPEDPVTGSAHCSLIPYWAEKLGKSKMFARQISPRGGEIWCENLGPRVSMAGRAVPYLEGTIQLP